MKKRVKQCRAILCFLILCATLFPWRLNAQSGATIRGRISYSGIPPKSSLISMAKDPNCLKINAGKKIYQEMVVVKDDGSIRNVFVHLKSGVPQKGYSSSSQPLVLDQKGCIYTPRVQGALVGQSLKITNSDQTLHNIHSQTPSYSLNIAQPISGMVYNLPLKTQEVMLAFKCEVHPWMSAYIGVLQHPFFSVSNVSGIYEVRNVPPGKYVMQAWHEQLGTVTKEIEVKVDSGATVDFTFDSKSAFASPSFHVIQQTIPEEQHCGS